MKVLFELYKNTWDHLYKRNINLHYQMAAVIYTFPSFILSFSYSLSIFRSVIFLLQPFQNERQNMILAIFTVAKCIVAIQSWLKMLFQLQTVRFKELTKYFKNHQTSLIKGVFFI